MYQHLRADHLGFASEEAFFSREAGKRFILNFVIYCQFHNDEAVRQVSLNVSFFLFGNNALAEAD